MNRRFTFQNIIFSAHVGMSYLWILAYPCENRVMLMMTRLPLVPISIAAKLSVIFLDCERMQAVEPTLRGYLGSVSYL